MTEAKYLRRAAWTLAGCSVVPVLIGIGELSSGKSEWGLPTGVMMGLSILVSTAIFMGAALLLCWAALGQGSFRRTLLIGFGTPLLLGALAFWLGEGEPTAVRLVLWVFVMALPVLLGSAAFHERDGRTWLRRGAWVLVALGRHTLAAVGWWPPLAVAAVLGAVLYWSIPGKPVRFGQLLLEGVAAAVLGGLSRKT
ncbi:MAG TPA: hypothetical protein VNT75_25700 [Symbiobacteriaceae bacterium]|nr:hypothetical protein [Symbiobacteriaceae bacterium]